MRLVRIEERAYKGRVLVGVRVRHKVGRVTLWRSRWTPYSTYVHDHLKEGR